MQENGGNTPARGQPGKYIDWLSIGRISWRGDSFTIRALSLLLDLAQRCTDRVLVQRFVRFELRLADLESAPSDIRLTPLTAEIIERLRAHPDTVHDAFASGLAFWDMGARTGFVWFDGDEPLCFQWQLTESDLCALRERSSWANLYPPLAPGMAQREKLWTFSSAREKGHGITFRAGHARRSTTPRRDHTRHARQRGERTGAVARDESRLETPRNDRPLYVRRA